MRASPGEEGLGTWEEEEIWGDLGALWDLGGEKKLGGFRGRCPRGCRTPARGSEHSPGLRTESANRGHRGRRREREELTAILGIWIPGSGQRAWSRALEGSREHSVCVVSKEGASQAGSPGHVREGFRQIQIQRCHLWWRQNRPARSWGTAGGRPEKQSRESQGTVGPGEA